MPIPQTLPIGILPPFLKDNPTNRDLTSPFRATTAELVDRYSTSKQRLRILEGFLRYREELRRIGFSDGFQWIDGSFVERLEREPNDLDVVTISSFPGSVAPDDEHLFSAREARRRFLCDAHFVDLASGRRFEAVEEAAYWLGLFSHQRKTQRWKGLVQIDLVTPEADALAWERLRALGGAA